MRAAKCSTGAAYVLIKPVASSTVVIQKSQARSAEDISRAIYSAREGFSRDDALRAFAGVERKQR